MRIYVFKAKRLYLAVAIVLIAILAIALIPRLRGKSIETNSVLAPIDKGLTKDKIMAFTCNIDWGNEYIPGILDTLEKSNIKITFFVTGRWAENYPELLKEIAQRGHEIGNHGYGHKNHKLLSIEGNKQEIIRTEQAIKKAVGGKINLFAPPSGSWGENTLTAAEQLGYTTILWTIDTIDWRDKDPNIILDRVIKKPVEGGIVLMHPTEGTSKALEAMIKKLLEKGYMIGRVSDVLK